VFPGQINHVNVAFGGEVHSVTFSDDDEWRTLESGQELSKSPN
jgi:hypothetical protein